MAEVSSRSRLRASKWGLSVQGLAVKVEEATQAFRQGWQALDGRGDQAHVEVTFTFVSCNDDGGDDKTERVVWRQQPIEVHV